MRSAKDGDLVRAARAGNENAIAELVREHWGTANRAAYLMLGDPHAAEDIAQEAMLAAVRALDSFSTDKPFGPWVRRIAANAAIDRLRAEAARPRQAGNVERQPAFAGEDSTLDPKLAAALADLSPEDRAAIVLRYVLNFRAAEIGEILGYGDATVRTRLHRALQHVRQRMEVSDQRMEVSDG